MLTSTQRRHHHPPAITALLVLLCLTLTAPALAGMTGKLSGRITDAATGQPLAGANIRLETLSLGAASDLNGFYTMLRIPPERYTVRISYVGYRTHVIDDVRIESGRATHLPVALEPAAVQTDEVVVQWKKPPVDLTATSEQAIVEGEVVRRLPMRRMAQVVSLTAGAVTDGSGDLHIRGGRAGEIAYYVDGVKVEDPLGGGRGQQISREFLQELSILTGSFNAEYGDAMSGIVKIITREGGDHYEGSLEYESGFLNKSPYRQADWTGTGGDSQRDPVTGASKYTKTEVLDELDPWIPVEGRLSATLSGPVPFTKNLTFFVLGISEPEDLWEPFGYKWVRKVMGKTAWTSPVGKFALSGTFRAADKKAYNHAWKYNPDHYHTKFDNSQRVGLSFTRSESEDLYYTVHLGYFRKESDAKICEEWGDYLQNIPLREQPLETLPEGAYFHDSDDWSDTYRDSWSRSLAFSSKVTWQMDAVHQWDAGLEARTHRVGLEDWRNLQIGYDGGRLGQVDRFEEDVIDGALFLQDNIELPSLVVNAGMRLDYVNPQSSGWSDIENPLALKEEAPASYQLSPRLGVAHPLTDKVTLHAAYGRFFQFPDYVNLFMNTTDLEPDSLLAGAFDVVGNRKLKPQKTVALEMGLKAVLNPDWGMTITGFRKDITDLVGTRQVLVGGSSAYAAIVNIDEATVSGLEVGLVRTLSNYWGVQVNYTWSKAEGSRLEEIPTSDDGSTLPREVYTEYPLDFDRTHVLNMMVSFATGREAYPAVFGTSLLKGVETGITVSAMSGLPYTPFSASGEQLGPLNSKRMDASVNVGLHLSKALLFEPVKLHVFTTITNLFDRTNPLEVNSRTGKPWGMTPGESLADYDRFHNPSHVDEPRIVRLGVGLEL